MSKDFKTEVLTTLRNYGSDTAQPMKPSISGSRTRNRAELCISETSVWELGMAQASDSDGTLLHIELSERVRARSMVDRLIRRFSLSGKAKLYGYNEGRRYTLG